MARKAKSGKSGSNSGHGGETHQTASASDARLTTNHGTPLSDNQNSVKPAPVGQLVGRLSSPREDSAFRS